MSFSLSSGSAEVPGAILPTRLEVSLIDRFTASVLLLLSSASDDDTLVDEDKVSSLLDVLDIVPGIRIVEGDSYAYCARRVLIFGKLSKSMLYSEPRIQ